MNIFFQSLVTMLGNGCGCGGEKCLGKRVEGQQGEVVSWIARVSTDYRKPDGSNSSVSRSPGLGFQPKHSVLFGLYHTLNYAKLTSEFKMQGQKDVTGSTM